MTNRDSICHPSTKYMGRLELGFSQPECSVYLGLQYKGRTIKGLVVCYVVWLRSIGWVFGLVACCGHQDSYRAQVPQHPIDSLEYHI